MRSKILFIASFLFQFSFAQNQMKVSELKAGDLLFEDLGESDLSNAIKKVTPDFRGKYFSHVGMLTEYGGRLVVIESYDKIADTVSFEKFKARTQQTIYVGRLKKEFQLLAAKATEEVKKYRGIKYDEKYLPDSNQLYCAELIYYVFKSVNQQQDFFKMQPMTFKDPDTKELFPGWVDYYQHYFHMNVPEGKMGINPGLLMNDKRLDIFELN